jgi:3-hydroxyisobutyrate dehydrogenase-like beta-hydroxyacid dehydrogenase
MIDVINAGSGRNTATESKFPKNIVPRTFDLGFTNGLMMKDVRLFLSEAEAMGVPVAVAQAVAALLKLACDEIGSECDLTTIVQPVETRAGVEVK